MVWSRRYAFYEYLKVLWMFYIKTGNTNSRQKNLLKLEMATFSQYYLTNFINSMKLFYKVDQPPLSKSTVHERWRTAQLPFRKGVTSYIKVRAWRWKMQKRLQSRLRLSEPIYQVSSRKIWNYIKPCNFCSTNDIKLKTIPD